MTSPDFSVSVPDLEGFAKQVRHLGVFYKSFEDKLRPYGGHTMEILDPDLPLPGNVGLNGSLHRFLEDFMNLAEAERGVFPRLGRGLTDMASELTATAAQYAETDKNAEAELEKTDGSESAKETADAITGGEPNSDWKDELDVEDYFADFDNLHHSGEDYRPKEMSYKNEMLDLEGVFGALSSGSLVGTIDATLQEIGGFSVIKEFIKPLTGDWAILWFFADLYAAASTGVDAALKMLRNGTDKLVGNEWTGPAAEAFRERSLAWQEVLGQQFGNLREASKLLKGMGDTIDDAGSDIAAALETLADQFLSIVGAAANPASAIIALGKAAFTMLEPAIAGAEGLIKVTDQAETSTADLCDEANGLKAP